MSRAGAPLVFRVGHEEFQAVDVPPDVPAHAVLGGVTADGQFVPPRPRATRTTLMRLGVSRVKSERRNAAEEAEANLQARLAAQAAKREQQQHQQAARSASGRAQSPSRLAMTNGPNSTRSLSNRDRHPSREANTARGTVKPFSSQHHESARSASFDPGAFSIDTAADASGWRRREERSTSVDVVAALPPLTRQPQRGVGESEEDHSPLGGHVAAGQVLLRGPWCECCGLPRPVHIVAAPSDVFHDAGRTMTTTDDESPGQFAQKLYTASPSPVRPSVETGASVAEETPADVPAHSPAVEADPVRATLVRQLEGLISSPFIAGVCVTVVVLAALHPRPLQPA